MIPSVRYICTLTAKDSVLYPYYEQDLSADARKALAQALTSTAGRFADTTDVTYTDNLGHTILTRHTEYLYYMKSIRIVLHVLLKILGLPECYATL